MQLAAVVLGVGPLYALVFYSGLQTLDAGKIEVTASGLITNLEVMLTFAIFLVALLLLLGDRVSDLQLKRGTLGSDIAQGIVLTVGMIGALFVLRIAAMALERAGLIPPTTGIPDSNLDLIGDVAQDPLLLALFLGPVIWIQAALVEELTRAFVLTRLWKVWPARRARIVSLVAWSLLFGLAHVYQGATGVIGTALIGLVLGAHYLARGRLLPLIIAHGLYDTLASLVLLYAVRHPELLQSAL
jgi:membrane protease YdiL (CAAX protease family)